MIMRVVLLVALMGINPALAEVRDGQLIRFEVLDAITGERLLKGVETIAVRQGTVNKRTVYQALDEREVMVETVSYELGSLRVNNFSSQHPETGEQLSLKRNGDRLQIRYVERAGVEEKRSDALTWDDATQMGKTLHHIIVRNWDSLVAGTSQRFMLLVPSKFDHYDFQLKHQPTTDGTFVFRLEPVSWLVRQFVSAMDFHYDVEKQAVKYVGPTTVGFYDDPDRRVEIRFSY